MYFMSSYSSGGYSGVLIQSRGLSLMGYILESDNSSVSTFGRRLQIEGFSTKKTVNLVSLLKQLIEVQNFFCIGCQKTSLEWLTVVIS